MSRGRSTFFSTAAASAVFRGGRRRDARPGGGRLGCVVGTSQVFAETGRSMRARDLCEARPSTCPSCRRTPRASASSSSAWSAGGSSPSPNPACSPSPSRNAGYEPATSEPHPTPRMKPTSNLITPSEKARASRSHRLRPLSSRRLRPGRRARGVRRVRRNYAANEAVLCPIRTRCQGGRPVDVVLFGSMEHVEGFRPGDAIDAGRVSSAAPAIEERRGPPA